MNGFLLRVESVEETVEDVAEIEQVFDELAVLPNTHGTYGRAYWIGPVGEPPALRVDLDPTTGAGAAHWLVDDLIAAEHGYEPQLVIVVEALDEPLVWIPPAIGRVSYAAAREAAERYVATGARPDNVAWIEAEADTVH